MNHIIYIVIHETEIPGESHPITTIDSVWDVFEHANDRAEEIGEESVASVDVRIEGLEINDAHSGRVHPSDVCSACGSPMLARMVTTTADDGTETTVPGYECADCGATECI